jgi:hypothetical protein
MEVSNRCRNDLLYRLSSAGAAAAAAAAPAGAQGRWRHKYSLLVDVIGGWWRVQTSEPVITSRYTLRAIPLDCRAIANIDWIGVLLNLSRVSSALAIRYFS